MNEPINWKARCEAAEKACAEMREALLYAQKGYYPYCNQIVKSLSSDAGRNYYHRDEFKPLVEALALVIPDCCCERSMDWKDTGLTHGSNCPVSIVSKVLADARAKGLIE